MAKKVINIMGMSCSAEGQEKFNKWYNEKHVPDLLKCKAVKKVTRYKLINAAGAVPNTVEFPGFLAVFEFADEKGYEEFNNSPELAAARQDTGRIFGETGGKLVWRVQFEEMATWDK
jgi:hypothetical protein